MYKYYIMTCKQKEINRKIVWVWVQQVKRAKTAHLV